MAQGKVGSQLLFILPATIWGSTFFVIKFQLGVVSPIWSVCYRFLLGGLILLVYARLRGLNLKFPAQSHGRIALQGILLFGLNYWLVYIAELELVSALVAIAFSTIIFFNILFGKLFLGNTTTSQVYVGAILGLVGTVLLFYQELGAVKYQQWPVLSTILCALSVVIASLGNITSAANQKVGIPVIQANAFGMIYGSIGMALIALVSLDLPAFDFSAGYMGSLLYLSILGSIVAFGSYLTLIGRIGPDRAAYVLVVIPVIALMLSVWFEDYNWSIFVVMGILLILVGNVLVLRKPKSPRISKA